MKQLIKEKLREELLNESRLPFSMDLPADILQIKDVFKNNKYDLFVVGGAVRDAVLGKKPKDFDLATDAVPDVVERIMQAAGFRTLGTGKSFGVINVFTETGEYEIATFRSDNFITKEPSLEDFKEYLKSVNYDRFEQFQNYLMK